ncbi:MAG: hypothetical protein IPK52_16345 [Chloroflexi bacterium]|nr:hypothetical protein [Chloroflexota bacterium]
MNRNIARWLLAIGVAAALMVAPVMAQDLLGAGEGQPVIWGNFGGDIATTNPILVNDGSSADVVARIYPVFIGTDPESGLETPGAARSLATDWSYSEDGTVLTFTLRDDWTWSDGTPITSADVKYAYDAIMSGEVDTPIGSFLTTVASLEAPDPTTVVVTFTTADCTAVSVAANIPVVPSHYYQTLYPTFAEMTTENPANLNPEVTAGAFKFANFRAGEQVTLLADQNYPDSPAGFVVPEGFVYKTVADQLVEFEQFLNGQITYSQAPEDREDEARERAANGEFTLLDRPSTGWQILLFNLANPANPQAGLDEEGNQIAQDPHPILSSLNVRQAITHAIDHAALNVGAFSDSGIPVGGPMLPQSWAYNANIAPYEYDPALSIQLLEEAGWVDDDGSIETPRVATDAVGTVAAGTPLNIVLTTFTGNLSVDSSSVLIQDQLKQVGIGVTLDIIEFSPMLDKLVGQTYDMLMVFWGVTPTAPQDMYDQLALEADIPGAGFNTGSFANPEFDALMKEARSLPGCDQEARKALYDQAQEIIHAEVPYYLVNTSIVPVIVQSSVENFDPKTNSTIWNLPAWSIRPQ